MYSYLAGCVCVCVCVYLLKFYCIFNILGIVCSSQMSLLFWLYIVCCVVVAVIVVEVYIAEGKVSLFPLLYLFLVYQGFEMACWATDSDSNAMWIQYSRRPYCFAQNIN